MLRAGRERTEELPGAVLGYHEDYLDVLEDGIDVEDF
jgi:hypothetical protein